MEIYDYKEIGQDNRLGASVARKYGVTAKAIRDIWNGRTWSSLTSSLQALSDNKKVKLRHFDSEIWCKRTSQGPDQKSMGRLPTTNANDPNANDLLGSQFSIRIPLVVMEPSHALSLIPYDSDTLSGILCQLPDTVLEAITDRILSQPKPNSDSSLSTITKLPPSSPYLEQEHTSVSPGIINKCFSNSFVILSFL